MNEVNQQNLLASTAHASRLVDPALPSWTIFTILSMPYNKFFEVPHYCYTSITEHVRWETY